MCLGRGSQGKVPRPVRKLQIINSLRGGPHGHRHRHFEGRHRSRDCIPTKIIQSNSIWVAGLLLGTSADVPSTAPNACAAFSGPQSTHQLVGVGCSTRAPHAAVAFARMAPLPLT